MISFNAEVIKEIKLRLPEVTCNLLTAFDPSYYEKDLPQLLKKIDADGVGVQNHVKLTKDFIENINKDVHVWTVNEGEKAKKYSLLGLSSITTNKPRYIKYFLSAS